MGIGSILAGAVRNVSWGQVANVALQYGPELIKKFKEIRQPQHPVEDDSATMIDQLHGRIEELESTLLTQQALIEQQTQTLAVLEEAAKSLQAKLRIVTAVAAGFVLLALILLVLLLRN